MLPDFEFHLLLHVQNHLAILVTFWSLNLVEVFHPGSLSFGLNFSRFRMSPFASSDTLEARRTESTVSQSMSCFVAPCSCWKNTPNGPSLYWWRFDQKPGLNGELTEHNLSSPIEGCTNFRRGLTPNRFLNLRWLRYWSIGLYKKSWGKNTPTQPSMKLPGRFQSSPLNFSKASESLGCPIRIPDTMCRSGKELSTLRITNKMVDPKIQTKNKSKLTMMFLILSKSARERKKQH